MRGAVAILVGLLTSFAFAGVAQAAKTYNDPWLEGDLQQIRVPGALDILARTPQHVIVGDIDSGARLSDADLAPHLLRMPMPYTCASAYGPGPNYAADPANGDFDCDFIGSGNEGTPSTAPDGDPTDPYGHGTGTAAIIAAVPNDGIEGAGVAPNARILPIRACYGGNPDCFDEPTLDGLRYAVAMGATIINASWPPEGLSTETRSFVRSHPQVLFDFAADGENSLPVCSEKTTYPNVICAGPANADDTPGAVNAEATTDVSAPGYAGVPSASGARREFGGQSDGATAHLSGAAALLRGLAPGLTPATIRQVLVSTSRHVAGFGTASKAHGIIDVEAAVRAVQQMEGLTTPEPGHGAAVDSPDPFAGQGAAEEAPPTTPTTPSTPTTPVTTPTPSTPATTPTPTAPATGPKPTPTAHLSLLRKLPHSVPAGTTLKLTLRETGGATGLTVKLVHGKKTLARATRPDVSGSLTLKLRVPPKAELGPAKLELKLGDAAPLVEKIVIAGKR